jgi:hypothetical protein
MAVTVAVELAPVIAGKVILAAWPTLTSAMSASAIAAVTVYFEVSAIVMKPDEDEDDDDELDAPLDPLDPLDPPDDDPPDELDDPPAALPPTSPFTAMTSPAIGATSVASARFSLAVVKAVAAESTASRAELTCWFAELTLLAPWEPPEEPDPLAALASALAREVRASARLLFARLSAVCAFVTAVCRSVVVRVPSTCPAVTVAPRATPTVAIVPEVANEAFTSWRGEIEPVAVIELLTVPCCTVPVSWVVAATVFAEKGLKMSSTLAPAMTMTAANAVLMTTGRESFMSAWCLTFL